MFIQRKVSSFSGRDRFGENLVKKVRTFVAVKISILSAGKIGTFFDSKSQQTAALVEAEI